jgi:hypothetical protein
MKEEEMGVVWNRYRIQENAYTSLVGKPKRKTPSLQ